MFIKDPKALENSCLKNGKECECLVGYWSPEDWKKYTPNDPYAPLVSCWRGEECGRGMCRHYKERVK